MAANLTAMHAAGKWQALAFWSRSREREARLAETQLLYSASDLLREN
jgi:hypothetical protein